MNTSRTNTVKPLLKTTKCWKQVIYLSVFLLYGTSCNSQAENQSNLIVGGGCEGCEAIFEYGNKSLKSTDTLPGFDDHTPQLKVSGVVYEKDGVTPADDVIIYIYQTNSDGIYESKKDAKGWARRHGYIRGWAKTGKSGKFAFYTFRPGAYPNTRIPEHIHITIKEPDLNEYYIDNVVFDDDPFLTQSERNGLTNRGGSGIVNPKKEGGMLVVERNIILGMNIPDYP